MKEEKLLNILKALKLIEPEEGFVRHSRQRIMHESRKSSLASFKANIFSSIKLGAALTLASALLFFALGGLSYFNVQNLSPILLTSLNDESIEEEAKNLDFQIQLGEAEYYVESEKEIGLQIDKLLENIPPSL